MATLTPNFNLSKPDASDQFDAFRQSYNDNMDIIDNNLGGGGGGGGSVNDVLVNGVSVVDGNGDAQITSYKEVTQAQYDALPSTKESDGIAYFIKDGHSSSSAVEESTIASVETSLVASRSYAIGEQFFYQGTLYTATAAITSGGTITINGNCTASDSITEQIRSVNQIESVSVTADGVQTMQALLNTLYANIDHSKMTTKSTLVYQNYVFVSTYQIAGSAYQFVSATLYNQKFYIQRITPRSGNNSGADTYNGTTYTDIKTTVPTNGTTITIYY